MNTSAYILNEVTHTDACLMYIFTFIIYYYLLNLSICIKETDIEACQILLLGFCWTKVGRMLDKRLNIIN